MFSGDETDEHTSTDCSRVLKDGWRGMAPDLIFCFVLVHLCLTDDYILIARIYPRSRNM